MTQTPGSARQIDLNRPEATEAVDRMFNHPSMDIALMTYDAHPEVLNDAAAAWHAASTRLAAFADTVRQKAAAAATAWSGTQASVGFQRDLKRLHDTVRGLAEASAGMQRMVESSAQMLSSFKDAFPYDHVPFMGNDMVDEMMNGLFRLLTDSYSQAIQDHGPTHLTTDYPKIAQRDMIDPRTQATDPAHGQSDWRGGVPGALAVGSGRETFPPLSGTPNAFSQSAPPDDPTLGSSNTLGPGSLNHFNGEPTLAASPGIIGSTTGSDPIGYDSPVGDTSLASYNPSGLGSGDFGASAPDGLTGSGATSGPSSGSGFGGGVRADGSPAFGMGANSGRQAPGSGMGMMPPNAGNTDDEEEERTPASWLAEDADVWGAKDVEASPAVLGAVEPERPRRGRRLRDVADS